MKLKIDVEICCSHEGCEVSVEDKVEFEELPTGQLAITGFNVPEDWDIKDVTDGAFTVLCPEHAK